MCQFCEKLRKKGTETAKNCFEISETSSAALWIWHVYLKIPFARLQILLLASRADFFVDFEATIASPLASVIASAWVKWKCKRTREIKFTYSRHFKALSFAYKGTLCAAGLERQINRNELKKKFKLKFECKFQSVDVEKCITLGGKTRLNWKKGNIAWVLDHFS